MNRKKLLHLAVFTALAFVVIKASTRGWNFLAPSYPGGPTLTRPERLRETVTALAVDIGPRDLFNNNKARLRRSEEYITARFKAAGCAVEYQEYYAGGVKVKNIVCVKPGATLPGEIVVVGAHYDTYNNPGADDNASGVVRRFYIWL